MWTNEPADGLVRLSGHVFRAVDGRPQDFLTTLAKSAPGVMVTAVRDKRPVRRFLAFADVPDVRAAVDSEHRRYQARGPLTGVLSAVHWLICLERDPSRRREIVAALVRDHGTPDADAVLRDCERISRGW